MFDYLAALTAGGFVCFFTFSASTAQSCQCGSTKRENDGRNTDVNSQTLPVDVMGRAESAPVEKRNVTAGTAPVEPLPSLRCPIVCQVEPR